GLAMAGVPRARIKQTVEHYLELVGLTGFERHYPYQLSGGMQQRVGLVRALALNPAIMMMDESFAALDSHTRVGLQDELLALMEVANLTGDQARAEQVASRRRWRRQWQIIGVRLASLAIVLSIWQVLGGRVDPILFTTPSKIVLAAVVMIGSGELWTYLAPSL